MAKQIQLRRGTTAENNAFKGALGEVTVDTTNKQLRLHDNSKVGGFKIPTYDDSQGVESLGYAGKAKVLNAGDFATQKYNTGWYTLSGTYTNSPVATVMSGLMLVSVRAFGAGSALIFQLFNNSSADYYIGQSTYTENSDGTVTPNSTISWKKVAYMDDVDLKLNITSAFGVGQTYQDVTSSRTLGTTYTNSTTKPILVSIKAGSALGTSYIAYVNNQEISGVLNNAQYVSVMSFAFVVPAGATYKVEGGTLTYWKELR